MVDALDDADDTRTAGPAYSLAAESGCLLGAIADDGTGISYADPSIRDFARNPEGQGG